METDRISWGFVSEPVVPGTLACTRSTSIAQKWLISPFIRWESAVLSFFLNSHELPRTKIIINDLGWGINQDPGNHGSLALLAIKLSSFGVLWFYMILYDFIWFYMPIFGRWNPASVFDQAAQLPTDRIAGQVVGDPWLRHRALSETHEGARCSCQPWEYEPCCRIKMAVTGCSRSNLWLLGWNGWNTLNQGLFMLKRLEGMILERCRYESWNWPIWATKALKYDHRWGNQEASVCVLCSSSLWHHMADTRGNAATHWARIWNLPSLAWASTRMV